MRVSASQRLKGLDCFAHAGQGSAPSRSPALCADCSCQWSTPIPTGPSDAHVTCPTAPASPTGSAAAKPQVKGRISAGRNGKKNLSALPDIQLIFLFQAAKYCKSQLKSDSDKSPSL